MPCRRPSRRSGAIGSEALGELVGGLGAGEQEALRPVAAEGDERVTLLDGLDPLGGAGDLERLGELDHRLDDGAVAGRARAGP